MTLDSRRTPAEAGTPVAVAAFDPGRNIGFALVAASGAALSLAILRLAEVDDLRLPERATVVVGSGTGRVELMRALARHGREVTQVDECDTTLLARDLWRRSTPARGWSRLLPTALRAPPGPIDDYAAWAIALRYLGLAPSDAPMRAHDRRRHG